MWLEAEREQKINGNRGRTSSNTIKWPESNSKGEETIEEKEEEEQHAWLKNPKHTHMKQNLEVISIYYHAKNLAVLIPFEGYTDKWNP